MTSACRLCAYKCGRQTDIRVRNKTEGYGGGTFYNDCACFSAQTPITGSTTRSLLYALYIKNNHKTKTPIEKAIHSRITTSQPTNGTAAIG